MSPKAESMRNAIVNALIDMVATLFILFGTGAWSSKADRSDVARIEKKLDRILDAICQQAPVGSARVCKESATP